MKLTSCNEDMMNCVYTLCIEACLVGPMFVRKYILLSLEHLESIGFSILSGTKAQFTFCSQSEIESPHLSLSMLGIVTEWTAGSFVAWVIGLGIIVKKLGAKLIPLGSHQMESADGVRDPIHYAVWLHVEIEGAAWVIAVLVIDGSSSYSLLLGRHWLSSVKALGDYEVGGYTIVDDSGKRVKMHRTRKPAFRVVEQP